MGAEVIRAIEQFLYREARLLDERRFHDWLQLEQWGLIPVAQLDSDKGLLFATFGSEAPPLVEYLGKMAWYLDNFFDRREGGIAAIGGMHRGVIPCNWKFPSARAPARASFHGVIRSTTR